MLSLKNKNRKCWNVLQVRKHLWKEKIVYISDPENVQHLIFTTHVKSELFHSPAFSLLGAVSENKVDISSQNK